MSTKKIENITPSLMLLFALTTNDREVIDQLKGISQQYNLNFARVTSKMQKNVPQFLSSFSTNANWIAWTYEPISNQRLAFLRQTFVSKVILCAFFSNNQVLPVSRLVALSAQNSATRDFVDTHNYFYQLGF